MCVCGTHAYFSLFIFRPPFPAYSPPPPPYPPHTQSVCGGGLPHTHTNKCFHTPALSGVYYNILRLVRKPHTHTKCVCGVGGLGGGRELVYECCSPARSAIPPPTNRECIRSYTPPPPPSPSYFILLICHYMTKACNKLQAVSRMKVRI